MRIHGFWYVKELVNIVEGEEEEFVLGLSDFEYSFNFETNVSNSCWRTSRVSRDLF